MSSNFPDIPSRRDSTAATNSRLVVILTVLVGILLFKSLYDAFQNRPNYASRTVTPRGDLAADEKSTIEVFENVSPSVVYIRMKGYQQADDGSIASREVASGTGFVWDEAGHIITNLHVVLDSLLKSGAELEVQLPDSQIYDAEFIGAVSKHDIAVLRISAKPSSLVPITIGASDDLKVGQKVLAIGNPFGFDRTLSTGVIGGLNRSVSTKEGNILAGLIQTDAAINPGNSGGPLLDSAGRLIGVNTAIISTSGASAGLGFAMPVNDVHQSVERVLLEVTNAPTPSIGVAILDLETARENGIPERMLSGGLVVLWVYPRSAAERAGLQGCRREGSSIFLGDQITAIDQQRVSSYEELQGILNNYKPGDSILLDVARGPNKHQIPVTLEARKVLL